MRPLPDCPSCDASATLDAVHSEGRGIIVCICSCCGKQCRVNADNKVVHKER